MIQASRIEALRQQARVDFDQVRDTKEVETLKVKYLGKKGPIQQLMKELKDVGHEERPTVGKQINDLKEEILQRCETLQGELGEKEEAKKIGEEKLDVTLPGRRQFLGRKHPLSQILDEVIDIAISLGFSVQYAPIIESDYYNFEALNFSPDHPARDMQDTFYLAPGVLLRTHCTNVQVRALETHRPPIRMICPGKAFRNEEVTARSQVLFHQIDALYVDEGVTFGDMLATLDAFFAKLQGQNVKTRYRPSYFPFVEPGMEVDIQCLLCKGKGCSICKKSGWLEVAGAGMIHPEVLRSGGVDPDIYTGFAWGMGLERLLMVRNKIPDIRYFVENDQRFLEQF